jgi:hypothetical protein
MARVNPACVAFVLSGLALAACTDTDPAAALGAPVDASAAIPFDAALGRPPLAEVTLRGEVAQVCTSAGCWFTLRERTADAFRELHVDLLPAADFRLDASAVGRTVVVRGRLGGEPERELHALGLRFE